MTFSDIASEHLRYHRWATERVIGKCLDIPAELLVKDLKGSFPTIYDYLAHLYQADKIWLDRLEGRPTGAREDYAAPGCTWELRDAWLIVQDKMIVWANTVEESAWPEARTYGTFSSGSFQSALWQMVLHVVNHGTHHRGQITNMLRQVDVKPENIDLIAFYRISTS